MGRSLLGVVVGVVVGFLIVGLVETLGIRLYPLPAGVDPTNPESIAVAMGDLPLASFLFVLAAWFLGAWTGATTAMRIARGTARWPGLAVGGLVLAASLFNLLTIPHPLWFAVVAVIGLVAVTLIASRPVGAVIRAGE